MNSSIACRKRSWWVIPLLALVGLPTFATAQPFTAEAQKDLEATMLHLRKEGKHVEALAVAQRLLVTAEKIHGPQSDELFMPLGVLADLSTRMGDFARAESFHLRLLQINVTVDGAGGPNTASQVATMAGFYESVGDYVQAEAFYLRALKILEVDRKETRLTKAGLLNRFAVFYTLRDNYPKAEQLFADCMVLFARELGPDHRFTAIPLRNLGMLYERQKDYRKAEAAYLRCLSVQEKSSGPESHATAIAVYCLAKLYSDMQEFKKSEPLFLRSLNIQETVLGKEHPALGTCIENMAHLCIRMGDHEKAESALMRALGLYQNAYGDAGALTQSVRRSMALLALERGQRASALSIVRKVKAIEELRMGNLLSFTSERQRLAYQQAIRPYDLLATLGSASDLGQALLRTKGVVLDSLLEDRRALVTAQDPKIGQLVGQLRAMNHRLMQFQAGAPTTQTPALLKRWKTEREVLEQQVEALQQQVSRAVTGLGQTRQALNVKLTGVQAVLPEHSVLLEFVRYQHYLGKEKFEPRYGVVLIGGPTVALKRANPGEAVWVPLGSAKAIDASLQTYSSVMRQGRTGDETVLRTLGKLLCEPIEDRLPSGTRTLFVSPDGQLGLLNFGTLLTSGGKFLAERFGLRYVASGRDLFLGAKSKGSPQSLVAFANPDFAQQTAGASASNPTASGMTSADKRDFSGLKLEPLPGTEVEAQFLRDGARKWGLRETIFVGTSATEAEVNRLRSPSVLHLATHGFFLPEPVATSASQGLSAEDGAVRIVLKNPMQRGGVALAGAQKTIQAWQRGQTPLAENDGILTAQEVGALNLQNTWLVVLSACDTGIGEARSGEGVMGLRRGFVQAGAQNLLMTLWPISDKWSVDIMKAFYEKAMVSGDAPQAMADVQAEWLARLRKEKGVLIAARIAGPFVLSTRGRQSTK